MSASKAEKLRALLWVALVLVFAYLLLVHWWWTAPMQAMGDEIRDLRDEELSLRMEAMQIDELREKLATVRAFETNNPGFLVEGNRELATASLVQRLDAEMRLASPSASACQITARQPLVSKTQEPFERVTIQVRLRCGIAEFSTLLYALERGSPQLFISNLDISGNRQYLAAGRSGVDGRVDIVFDLYGYLKTSAGSKG